MARVASFRTDSSAEEQGAWIEPGEEFDDLRIKTRGFTDVYRDAQAARLRRAAVPFGGDESKVPNAVRRAVLIECLVKHVVLDVENLEDENGPVEFAQFCEMLRNPDYKALVTAVLKAASMVGLQQQADLEEALPNSAAPSA